MAAFANTSIKPARNWCFTINNPEPEDDPAKWESRYCVWQLEEGADKTPHYQGYVEFNSVKRLAAVKKINGRAHWENRKGPQEKAIEYCRKEEGRLDGPFESGEKAPGAGARTDLAVVAAAVKAGASMQEIADKYETTFILHGKKIEHWRSVLHSTPYTHETVRGVWFYGPPGTGKSHTARERYPNAYVKMQNKWWDGYAGEHHVLLDDFDMNGGDKLGHYMKIWADKYACSGEVKNSMLQLQHRVLVVTSNYHPNQIWEGEMLKAIERRFTFTHFDKLRDRDDTSAPAARSRKRPPPPMSAANLPSGVCSATTLAVTTPVLNETQTKWTTPTPLEDCTLTETEQILLEATSLRCNEESDDDEGMDF